MKSRKELKDLVSILKLFFVIFVIATIIFMIMAGYFRGMNYKLQTQLSECQEKVPIWTLKVECKYPLIDFYHYSEKNYTNYNEYLEGWQRVIDFENCEVLD